MYIDPHRLLSYNENLVLEANIIRKSRSRCGFTEMTVKLQNFKVLWRLEIDIEQQVALLWQKISFKANTFYNV